jgi:hypothetical protein
VTVFVAATSYKRYEGAGGSSHANEVKPMSAQELDLIEQLGCQLAASLEYYEADPTKWYEPAVDVINRAGVFLVQNGRELPGDFQSIFRRRAL